MKKSSVGKGIFLVATPDLVDPNFRRTVILICEHGPKGSMGLVVNRPSNRPVLDLLPRATGPTGAAALVHIGGPCESDGLMVLHRLHKKVKGSLEIVPGVHLGGDPEKLKTLLGEAREANEGVRVYVGYAGWGAKQLDRELASGGWWTCPADPHLIFDCDPGKVWSEILWSMGGIRRIYAALPPDPDLN